MLIGPDVAACLLRERTTVQYTIEARELTRASDIGLPQTTIEARDADEAIARFVSDNHSELMSFTKSPGVESIATVKRNDAVFLVRVYTA
jgi:hypothetical protein